MKFLTRIKTLLIVLVTIPAVLIAQQGVTVIKARNSNMLADVLLNALKVIPIDGDGNSFDPITDPCDGVLATTVPISITADTVVISAVASTKNYICNITIVAGAAEIVSITEGTGSTCASGEVAIVGSTTDANGMSFAANGGFVNTKTISGIGTNVDTCLNVSGSNRVAGFLTYVHE